MKHFSFLSLLFFPMVFLAQNLEKISYTHSPNGEMVFDTYDFFLNDEYGGLNFYFEDETNFYEKATYRLRCTPSVTTALIRLQSENKIRVKSGPYSESIKIDANELVYYTTKIDSFFVATNISLKDKVINKPTILQYLGDSEKADYAMYYKLNNGTVSKKKILQLKKDDNRRWEELDLNAEDPKKILAFFGFTKTLNAFYDKQELTINDFLNTLKVEEYYNHHKNNTNILYDKLWREVKKPELASYYGKVTKIVDSIFSVEITDGKGLKLYDLNYSSLHPLKRHDTLVVYDNNKIKMERTYDYGDLISSKRYKDGQALLEFNYFKFDMGDAKPDVIRRRGAQIGSYPIEDFGANSAVIDHFSQPFHYELDKKDVLSTYTEAPNGKMYLYSNYTEPLDFDGFTYSLRTFLESYSGFNNMLVPKDLEGSMLLQLVTDFKGRMVSYEILDDNNEVLRKLVEPFCESFLKSEGRNRMRFKQIKLEDKKDHCTFILPINFEHRQFYKTFSRPSYNNWNWHWHHWHWQQQQMMWQQQQMMNSLPKF